jgi:glycine/D-amino acid oxidase-like deaminating enzyme
VGAVHAGGRLVAVDTPRGRFEGDLFLDCTNAWSRRTARVLGAEVLPVDPLKRYLWFLPRDGGMSAETLSAMPLVVSPSGVYCRPENADTLMVGRAHPTAPEPDFTYEDQDRIEPAFAHNTGFDSEAYAAWGALAEVLPPIGAFGGIASTTCGYYGSTPDHNPFLGYDRQVPNLVRLVGFSGHGAMFGPFTALVARALCEAGRDVAYVLVDGEPVPIDAFRVGRPFEHKEQMVL